LKAAYNVLVSSVESERGVNCKNHGVPRVNLHRPTSTSTKFSLFPLTHNKGPPAHPVGGGGVGHYRTAEAAILCMQQWPSIDKP